MTSSSFPFLDSTHSVVLLRIGVDKIMLRNVFLRDGIFNPQPINTVDVACVSLLSRKPLYPGATLLVIYYNGSSVVCASCVICVLYILTTVDTTITVSLIDTGGGKRQDKSFCTKRKRGEKLSFPSDKLLNTMKNEPMMIFSLERGSFPRNPPMTAAAVFSSFLP